MRAGRTMEAEGCVLIHMCHVYGHSMNLLVHPQPMGNPNQTLIGYLREGVYLCPHGTLKPQLPSHITNLPLADSCSSSFWGEIQNSGY